MLPKNRIGMMAKRCAFSLALIIPITTKAHSNRGFLIMATASIYATDAAGPPSPVLIFPDKGIYCERSRFDKYSTREPSNVVEQPLKSVNLLGQVRARPRRGRRDGRTAGCDSSRYAEPSVT